ncbi:hypothetical protein [Streptomyces tsukubensis]|uniref:Uncharacterized protein n=1 Tax=Streptomyces tsukubensis TaxID=83656 RepID=A0A1V4AAE1_9ACTN|nr:hypothetical protein [Streptomyces tsukubensis]OON80762.1 hypothetical protein B1H18_10155 [Streptomyces tsukubensis]QFR93600.1 hypothetical protein GBW32_11510 [Streptomyces tsukubensis]
MAASAHLLLSALSKRQDLPAQPVVRTELPERTGPRATRPDLSAVSGPDSGLDGSCTCGFTESPLTSEPPLADAAPLTSEPPLADAAPLTSEPTSMGSAGYPDPSVV